MSVGNGARPSCPRFPSKATHQEGKRALKERQIPGPAGIALGYYHLLGVKGGKRSEAMPHVT